MIDNKHIGRLKALFMFIVFIVSTVALIIMYNCNYGRCKNVSGGRDDMSVFLPNKQHDGRIGKHLSFLSYPIHSQNSRLLNGKHQPTYNNLFEEDFKFDINKRDVIVFLHIQKTGGVVFGRHLTNDLQLEKPCRCDSMKKICTCERPSVKHSYWLFSQESNGWKCGLHPDWTELTSCVDKVLDEEEMKASKRRYFYVTLLRNPIERFLSEYKHVKNGRKWRDSHHSCNGEKWVLPSCFDSSRKSMKMQKFLSCPDNLSVNRQTRMLADLTLVGCYDNEKLSSEERDTILLASAKNNLRKMAYFGLAEHQFKSKFMFEKTFNLHFTRNFRQKNKTVGSRVLRRLSNDMLKEVKRVNYLDIALYKYAEKLFHSRFKAMSKDFPNLDDSDDNGKVQSWAEIEDLDPDYIV